MTAWIYETPLPSSDMDRAQESADYHKAERGRMADLLRRATALLRRMAPHPPDEAEYRAVLDAAAELSARS